MHSYVVRMYRIPEDHRQEWVGVIEEQGQNLPLAFRNIDELWTILVAKAAAGHELYKEK